MLRFGTIIFFLLLINAVVASAQKVIKIEKATEFSSRVFGDDFFGVVFDESYADNRVSLISQNGKFYAMRTDTLSLEEIQKFKRFTPSKDDLYDAELILQSQADSLCNKLPGVNSVGDPDIMPKFDKYFRQYFGFINKEGEKIIFINSVLNTIFKFSGDRRELANEFLLVFDGGDVTWQAKVNITKHRLFDFGINGGF